MMYPELHLDRLLIAFTDGGVDFVVVGGVAVIALGYVRMTADLDVCYSAEAENLDALGRVLVGLDARLRAIDDDIPFVPDARTLRQTEILTLTTREGAVDLLLSPSGAPDYATLRQRAERAVIEDRVVHIAALQDMLAMKRASGRPKDLADLEALETIERTRRRPTSG